MSRINDLKELQAARTEQVSIGKERLDNLGKLHKAQQASRKPGANPNLGRYIQIRQKKAGELNERYEAAGQRFEAARARVENPHANILRAPAGRQPARAPQPGAQPRPRQAARTAQRAEPSPAAARKPGLFQRLTHRLFSRSR